MNLEAEYNAKTQRSLLELMGAVIVQRRPLLDPDCPGHMIPGSDTHLLGCFQWFQAFEISQQRFCGFRHKDLQATESIRQLGEAAGPYFATKSAKTRRLAQLYRTKREWTLRGREAGWKAQVQRCLASELKMLREMVDAYSDAIGPKECSADALELQKWLRCTQRVKTPRPIGSPR